MSKHTPGPWMATTAGPVMEGYSQGHAIASLEQNTLVAGCFSDVRGGTAIAAANAQLIAAAPDLLAALERSLNWLSSYPGGCSLPAYDQARAAIDKATAPN